MRTLLVGLATLVCVGLAGSAKAAERRMFIIVNDTTYGVDRCLASGAKCGAAAASAYCKAHQFIEAASYSKVARDDITGAIPTEGSGGCHGAACDDFVAIVCSR